MARLGARYPMAGFFAPAKPAYMPSLAITWPLSRIRVLCGTWGSMPNGRNASSGCSGSTSRPARPAAGRCGSSRASRIYPVAAPREWQVPSLARRHGFPDSPARPSVAGRSPAGSDVKSLSVTPAHLRPPGCESVGARSPAAAAEPGATAAGAVRRDGVTPGCLRMDCAVSGAARVEVGPVVGERRKTRPRMSYRYGFRTPTCRPDVVRWSARVCRSCPD